MPYSIYCEREMERDKFNEVGEVINSVLDKRLKMVAREEFSCVWETNQRTVSSGRMSSSIGRFCCAL